MDETFWYDLGLFLADPYVSVLWDVCCYCLLYKRGVKTPQIFKSLLSRLTTKEQYETREERRKKRKKERGPKKKRKKNSFVYCSTKP